MYLIKLSKSLPGAVLIGIHLKIADLNSFSAALSLKHSSSNRAISEHTASGYLTGISRYHSFFMAVSYAMNVYKNPIKQPAFLSVYINFYGNFMCFDKLKFHRSFMGLPFMA